jgi:cytochrome c biogenesis protein CcmG/thiol:disulfide interchange protein DsbE
LERTADTPHQSNKITLVVLWLLWTAASAFGFGLGWYLAANFFWGGFPCSASADPFEAFSFLVLLGIPIAVFQALILFFLCRRIFSSKHIVAWIPFTLVGVFFLVLPTWLVCDWLAMMYFGPVLVVPGAFVLGILQIGILRNYGFGASWLAATVLGVWISWILVTGGAILSDLSVSLIAVTCFVGLGLGFGQASVLVRGLAKQDYKLHIALPGIFISLFVVIGFAIAGTAISLKTVSENIAIQPVDLYQKPAPYFSIPPAIEGLSLGFSRDDLKGQISIIFIFGVENSEASIEPDLLKALQKSFDVKLYGIILGGDEQDAVAWSSKFGYLFTGLGVDPSGKVSRKFKVKDISERSIVFVINKNGFITSVRWGPLELDDFFGLVAGARFRNLP